MQNTLCDLRHPALIESVHTKVAADAAADVQLLLVPVAAVGAFPVACFVPDQRLFIAMLAVDFITFFIVSKLWLVRHLHVLRLKIILRFV